MKALITSFNFMIDRCSRWRLHAQVYTFIRRPWIWDEIENQTEGCLDVWSTESRGWNGLVWVTLDIIESNWNWMSVFKVMIRFHKHFLVLLKSSDNCSLTEVTLKWIKVKLDFTCAKTVFYLILNYSLKTWWLMNWSEIRFYICKDSVLSDSKL